MNVIDTWRYNYLLGNSATKLLGGERYGFAIDATTYDTVTAAPYIGGPVGGTVAIHADNVTDKGNVPLDAVAAFAQGASPLSQSGTSAKMVHFPSSPYVRWSPHNLAAETETLSTWDNLTEVTVTANATTAPDGTMTADLVIPSAVSSEHHCTESAHGASMFVVGFPYTVSIYAKASGYDFVGIGGHDAGGDFMAIFNLGTGAFDSYRAGGVTELSNTIESVGNAWYRCSVTFIATGTGNNIQFKVGDTAAHVNSAWSGNTTSGIYGWGAQVVRGYNANPYLVTTTAARIGIPQTYDADEEQYGILIEPAATNVAIWSEELDTSWGNPGGIASVTQDAATSPDGSTNAVRFTETSGGGTHSTNQQTGSYTGSTPVTLSCYLKYQSRQYLHISGSGASTSGNWFLGNFDIQNGTVISSQAGASGTIIGATITSIGDGWYRCTVTGTLATDNPLWIYLGASEATPTISGFGEVSMTTNGSSWLAWGFQAEQGTVATSYIPTLGSTVTRAVDDLRVPLSALMTLGSSYSMYFDVKGFNVTDSRYIGVMAESGSSNDIAGFSVALGSPNFYVANEAATQADEFPGVMMAGVRTQLAGSVTANSFLSICDGGTVASDTSGSIADELANLCLGSRESSGPWTGLIYRCFVEPRVQSYPQLVSLTTTTPTEGAQGLLQPETQGFAIDATTYDSVVPARYVGGPVGGTVSVRDTTTAANNFGNKALNASNLTQSGTSPKMVHNTASPYVRWTPHNYIKESQTLSTTWTPSSITVTANNTTAPDGTATADLLTSSGGSNYLRIQTAGTDVSANITYTVSVYAKSGSVNWFKINVSDYTANAITANYNLSTGAVGTASGFGGGDTIISTDTDYAGNGWYRCSMTFTVDAWATQPYMAMIVNTADNTEGAGTIYCWGAQINRGPIATPYVPTTSANVIGIPQSYDAAAAQYGMLVEPAATNIAQFSETFASPGSSNNLTMTNNDAVAPNGATTASKFAAAGTSGFHTYQTCTISASTVYTASCYVKAGTLTYAAVSMNDVGDSTRWIYAAANLSTGVITASGTGAGGTLSGSAIVDVGNGWYRLSVSGNVVGTSSQIQVQPLKTGTPTMSSYGRSADNNVTAGEYIHAWGAQYETGSVATSYVPTLGASATRAADVLATGLNLPAYSTELSMYISCVLKAVVINYGFVAVNTTSLEEFYPGSSIAMQFHGGTGGSGSHTAGAYVVGTPFKLAGRWKTNDYKAAIGGTLSSGDTSGTLVSGAGNNKLFFYENSGQIQNMMVYEVIYLPRILDDTSLQAITT